MGDTNLAACATVQAFVPACSILTPGFQTITDPVLQAECYCYSKDSWNPNFYDGFYLDCLSYYATATPAVLTSLASAQGGTLITAPCHALGDFKSQLPPSTTNPGLLACASVDGHFLTCYSKTPGFSTIVESTKIAECLCYSDLSWQPKIFDDPWTSCASYLSTASPAAFSTFVGAVAPSIPSAPCGDFGDVLHTTPPTPGPSPNKPSPTPTNPPVDPGPSDSPTPDPVKPSPSSTPEPGTSPSSPISIVSVSSESEETPETPSTILFTPIPSISSESENSPDPSSPDTPNESPTPTPGPLLPSFVRSSSDSGPPPTILSNTNDPLTNTNCAAVESLQGNCLVRSPGFSTITDFKTAASCLCYSGIVWQPTVYDNLWSGCVSYLSTAFSGEYSLVTASVGQAGLASYAAPCSFVGDVLAGSRITVVVTPSNTGAGVLPTSSQSAAVKGMKNNFGLLMACSLIALVNLL